jgi:hypothetical protein
MNDALRKTRPFIAVYITVYTAARHTYTGTLSLPISYTRVWILSCTFPYKIFNFDISHSVRHY